MNSDHFADVSKSKTLKAHTLKKMITVPIIDLIDKRIENFTEWEYKILNSILWEIDEILTPTRRLEFVTAIRAKEDVIK